MMFTSSPPRGPCSFSHSRPGETLRIAHPVGPDLRSGARPIDEWIVGRHLAVGPDAHDLADVIGEILRLVARAEMIAERDEEITVGGLHDAAAEIGPAARPALGEDP